MRRQRPRRSLLFLFQSHPEGGFVARYRGPRLWGVVLLVLTLIVAAILGVGPEMLLKAFLGLVLENLPK